MEKNVLDSLTPDDLPVLLPSHPDDEAQEPAPAAVAVPAPSAFTPPCSN